MAHGRFWVQGQWLALIALVVVGASPRQALAEVGSGDGAGHGLSIHFEGPAACGPRDALLRRTLQLLEHSDSTPAIAVDARVSHHSSGEYTLWLRLTGAVEGERQLRTSTCDEALKAGAVVIALAIDPEALSKQQQTDADSSAEAEDEASAARVDYDSSEDDRGVESAPADSFVVAPSSRLNTRRFIGAAGSFSYGPVAQPHVGGMLSLAYEIEWLRLGAYGYFDPQTEHESDVAGTVELGAYGGGGQLCARVAHWPKVDLHWCGGARVSRISVSAAELEAAQTRRATQVALITEALASFHVATPLSLVVSAGAALPTTQARFVVDADGDESQAILEPAAGLVAAAGIQFEL